MSKKTLRSELVEQAQEILEACPLIPVISIRHPDHALPLAEALISGGLRVLEVTLRTPHGLEAIRQLRQAFPDVWVGAGTVLGPEQFDQAVDHGAQFIITPGITRKLLKHGLEAEVPLIPGIATVSELMEGVALGYRSFKFFPAEVAGGVAALKAFAGPIPEVRFCPTGGIRQETAKNYLALDNVCAVGGTWLTPGEVIDQGDWARITEIAKSSLAALA